MAGTVTITEETGTMQKVTFAWTSDWFGGDADATTEHYFSGMVHRVVFIPGSGAATPDDKYDVLIKDNDGVDILDNRGKSRSNAVTEQIIRASISAIRKSQLTLRVTNAGKGKTGTVIIYIR